MFFSFANKNVREGGGFTVPSDIARSGKNIYLLVYIHLYNNVLPFMKRGVLLRGVTEGVYIMGRELMKVNTSEYILGGGWVSREGWDADWVRAG